MTARKCSARRVTGYLRATSLLPRARLHDTHRYTDFFTNLLIKKWIKVKLPSHLVKIPFDESETLKS